MENKRLVWVDALNIVACASVLLLHCTNGEVHNFSGAASDNWFIGLFTHSFFLWPVDVFFMISGFTLINMRNFDYHNNTGGGGVKLFYSRRLKRLLVPLMVWNLLYMAISFAVGYVKGEPVDSVSDIMVKFLLFKYNSHMWFFIPLILIYISLPFFAKFVLNSSRNLLRTFLIIGLILGVVSQTGTQFTDYTEFRSMCLMGGHYFYFVVAGYYIGHYEICARTRRKIYLYSLVSALIIFVGTYFLTLYAHEHYRYFLSYTNIPCALTAIGVFIFFRYANWDNILNKIHLTSQQLVTFSGLSLGIYLIQSAWFLVLRVVDVLQEQILLRFILMYVLCAGSVFVIKKIPLVRKIVG